MATPVTDLRHRLRGAGFTEAQADAIAAGFEALDRRMGGIETRLERVEGRVRTLMWVFGLGIDVVVALQATMLGVLLNLLARVPPG